MCKEIPLSRGMVALVDDGDYERVSRFKWCVDRNGYACRMTGYYMTPDGTRRRDKVLLHRFILDAPSGFEVDHINHDILDNRRANLRLVTRQQNRANARANKGGSSRYKGVYRHKPSGKWYATITVDGRKYHLGSFAGEVEAAHCYDRAVRDMVGPHGYTNFPTALAAD